MGAHTKFTLRTNPWPCRECGEQIQQKGSGRPRLTHFECKEAAKSPYIPKPKRPPWNRSRQCVDCGISFIARSPNQKSCRGPNCRYGREGAWRQANPSCRHCGKPITGRTRLFCDIYCTRKSAFKVKPLKTVICPGCNREFKQNRPYQKYCTKKCLNKTRWRNDNHLRRHKARENGDYEIISNDDIYARDAWRCQLCCKKVLKSWRGTSHPRAPELDHIVPLSRGGKHVRTNVQCSCRSCNIAKGDRPLGQLRLFG